MIKLSIVIPFYNVEKYIAQCLDSAVNQDIPLSDYEIICVNDASPDGSRDIVLDYMKRYPNIRLIEHEHNKKLGTARNTGRSIARGKYIWNVDSDDYIKPNCIKSLIEICENEDLDILMFNLNLVVGKDEKKDGARNNIASKCCSGIDFILQNSSMIGAFSPVWTQIYKKSFLETNYIFSPPINVGEDLPFSYKALYLAERIKFVNQYCYYYRRNDSSIGGSIEYNIKALSLYEKCLVCPRYMSEMVHASVTDSSVRYIYDSIIKYTIYWLPEYYSKLKEMEKAKFKDICRKNIWKDKCLFYYMGKKFAMKHFIRIINPF